MRAVLWQDYVCPWAWYGRARLAVFDRHDITVDRRAYELHPELPPEGRPIRPDGRLHLLMRSIAASCEAEGWPMTVPDRSPNTRLALETVEAARAVDAHLLDPLDDALARARWIDNADLGDADVVDALVRRVGDPLDIDVDRVLAARAEGVGARALDASMAEARALGVTATPAWWVDDRLLVPGVVEPEVLDRWLGRLATN